MTPEQMALSEECSEVARQLRKELGVQGKATLADALCLAGRCGIGVAVVREPIERSFWEPAEYGGVLIHIEQERNANAEGWMIATMCAGWALDFPARLLTDDDAEYARIAFAGSWILGIDLGDRHRAMDAPQAGPAGGVG